MDESFKLWPDAECVDIIRREYGIDLEDADTKGDRLDGWVVRNDALMEEDASSPLKINSTLFGNIKQEPITDPTNGHDLLQNLLNAQLAQSHQQLQNNNNVTMNHNILGQLMMEARSCQPTSEAVPDPQQHFDQHAIRMLNRQLKLQPQQPIRSESFNMDDAHNASLTSSKLWSVKSSYVLASRMSSSSSQQSVSPPLTASHVGKTPKNSSFARRRALSAVDLRHPDQTLVSPTTKATPLPSLSNTGIKSPSINNTAQSLLDDQSTSIPSSCTAQYASALAIRYFPILKVPDEELAYYRINPIKPPFTYTELVAKAIVSVQGANPERGAMLKEIYSFIENNFLFYGRAAKIGSQSWKSSVRHNLIFSTAFEKYEGPPGHRYGNSRDAKWWRITESHYGPRTAAPQPPVQPLQDLKVNSIGVDSVVELAQLTAKITSNVSISPLASTPSGNNRAASAPVSPRTPYNSVLQTPKSDDANLRTVNSPMATTDSTIAFLRPTPFHLPVNREPAVERSVSLVSDVVASILSPIQDISEDIYGGSINDSSARLARLTLPTSPSGISSASHHLIQHVLSSPGMQQRSPNLLQYQSPAKNILPIASTDILGNESQLQFRTSAFNDIELESLHSPSIFSRSAIMPTWRTDSEDNLQHLIALEELLR